MTSHRVQGGPRRARVALAAALTLAGGLAGGGAALAHGTHYDCQIHHFRPYPHRHVDPGAAVVNCARAKAPGGYVTTAYCEALARRSGGKGQIVPGAQTTAAVPIRAQDPASVKANAINHACDEALAACAEMARRAGAAGASCQVIDQRMGR